MVYPGEADAEKWGIRDKDIVRVSQAMTFVHLDTDEGNAGNMGDSGEKIVYG